jgi:hypothetical protein
MLVAVQGLGSIWERRLAADQSNARRFARAAYYNTTGVVLNGRLRYRWRIGGKLRFHQAGGFNPNYPRRALGRVFECAKPELRDGWSQILFESVVRTPVRPDFYLFAVDTQTTGYVEIAAPSWKADDVQVVSVSEAHGTQQILLLMPAYAWVRSAVGTFFVEPLSQRRWSAELQFEHA